jgi:hypothetical protein
MMDAEFEHNPDQDIAVREAQARDLANLFGDGIVAQARLIDIADLNMTDEMTAAIGEGMRKLKQLRNDPQAQRQWLEQQQAGLRLLLCLWIMDMELLEKIGKS